MTGRERILKFQFYLSSIKRLLRFYNFFNFRKFQFYLSSIKSERHFL